MANADLITLRNKKTGQLVQVPRSQFIENKPTQGMAAIGEDVSNSLANLPRAAGEMIPKIASGAVAAGKNIFQHPLQSALSVPAGIGEGYVAMERAPANFAQYLANKGLMNQKDAETYKKYQIPEDLGIEKRLGVDKGEGNAFIKMLSSLLIPGKAAKMMLPEKVAIPAAVGTLAAGQNQDPLQASLLGALMPLILKKGAAAVNRIPKAVNAAAGIEPPATPPPPGAASPGEMAASAPDEPLNPSAPQLPGMNWAAQLPSSVSWMKNIPQAALNVVKEVPTTAKNIAAKIPEVAANAAASGLETGADALSNIPGATSVIQPTMGALASYLKYLAVPPEEMAKRKLFGDIRPSDLPRISERVAAAKRAGLEYITPAEATLRPIEGAKQGTVGRTTAGADLLNEMGEKRTGSEVNATNDLLNTIYNENELAPEKKAAYDETMSGRVTPEFIAKHSKRPVIKEAMDKLANNSAYRQMVEDELGVPLEKVNPKTFRYWDIVKRVLGDTEEGKKDKMGRATTESAEIGKTRRALVKEMDAIKPEYATARNISERKYTRQKVEDAFDKKPMTGNNLHKFLSSKKNYDSLVHKLEGLPEAQQKLNDLHLLGGDLIPNDINIRTAAALKRTGMSDPRNKLDAAKRDLDERYGQEHDVAMVKLMTDPNWQDALAEYLKKKGK